MKLSDTKKLESAIRVSITKCSKCGHTQQMLPTVNKAICTWCGNYIDNKSISWFRYNAFKKINEVRGN